MPKLTVYEKPTCTTCRSVSRILTEQGVDFEKVNYFIDPLPEKKLKILFKKMGIRPGEALRSKEEAYKKLEFKKKNYSDDDIIKLMVKHPEILQRPIVEFGDKAILARPAEKIRELFK